MSDPWYREGLCFECQRCGACCTGDPGYVYFQRGEAEAVAKHLGMRVTEFRRRYMRKDGGRLSVREEADGRCVFFEEGKCRIYRLRPVQCRTFPFWKWNVAKKENWDIVAGECPGVGKGRRFTLAEIRIRLMKRIG